MLSTNNEDTVVKLTIPKEFLVDLNNDRFNDFFERIEVAAKDSLICGRYELETIQMLKDAFKNIVQ